MRSTRSHLRRLSLDEQLLRFRETLPSPPQGGWVKGIRESLGMSLEAFGRRMGSSRQSVHQLEQAEQDGSVTLKRLRAAAEALDCDLKIVVVPRKPLEETIREQALSVARAEVQRIAHSMALEAQAISQARLNLMIARRAEELIEQGGPVLWE